MRRLLACLAAIAALTTPALASVVSWGPAQDLFSAADVSTNGASVSAFNGGTVDAVVAGTNFVAANPFLAQYPGDAFAAPLFNPGTGDAGFNTLIGQAAFTFDPIIDVSTGTIDLGVFTPGRLYEVQVFFADQRTAANERTNRIGSFDTSGPGATVDLESDPNNAPTAPFGQFAIGTFLADGDDPDLTVAGFNFPSAQINGWQVRDITQSVVPEPGMFAVFALGALMHLPSRRTRG